MTTERIVTDEQVAKLAKRQWELFRRVKEGTLDVDKICLSLQKLIESDRLSFNIVVDYERSLSEMIKAGKYDWPNNDIAADHFPIKGKDKGKQEKNVVLFHFDKTMSSEQVIVEMDKEGFLPAKIEDNLALGEIQPELQKQFPIVALGSIWRDAVALPRVSCLYWDGTRRALHLCWFAYSWDPDSRFLAVRK